ncbi:MAG: leucine-rich repeat protein [Solobacterium sp.]|nr:leucine-rich repeat protein [Solobacterium sp.]
MKFKQRMIAALTGTAVLFMLFPPAALHAEPEEDFTYTVTNGNAVISGYTGKSTTLSIPETVGEEEYPVTAIGTEAFKDHTSLNQVTLPNTVIRIEDHAFEGCSKLESITFSDQLTEIGAFAFSNDQKLKEVVFPSTLETIGERAFYDARSLLEVTIPKTVTSIGSEAFAIQEGSTPSLKSVVITAGSTLTAIPEGLFQNQSALKTVSLPSSVTEVSDSSFAGCQSLTTINLSAVKTIGDEAFADCDSLTVSIPNAVSIGYRAFAGVGGTFSVPDSLKEIDAGAFADSAFQSFSATTANPLVRTDGDGLYFLDEEEVTLIAYASGNGKASYVINEGTTCIGQEAFGSSKSALESLVIPDTVTSIQDEAFSNAFHSDGEVKLVIPDHVTQLGTAVFKDNPSLTEVTLGKGITSIPERSFKGDKALTTVVYSDDLTSIDAEAFWGCEQLELTISDTVTTISPFAFDSWKNVSDWGKNFKVVEDTWLLSADETILYALNPETEETELTVPDSVKVIESHALAIGAEQDPIQFTIPSTVSELNDQCVGYQRMTDGTYERIEGSYLLSDSAEKNPVVSYAEENNLACFSDTPAQNITEASLTPGTATDFVISNALSSVQYESSDPSIATVDKTGRITGVSNGETVITAVSGTMRFEVAVTVNEAEPSPVPSPSATSSPSSSSESSAPSPSSTPATVTVTCQDAGFPQGWTWDESKKACVAPVVSETAPSAAPTVRPSASPSASVTSPAGSQSESAVSEETQEEEVTEPSPSSALEETPKEEPSFPEEEKPIEMINTEGTLWFLGIPIIMLIAGILTYMVKDDRFVPWIIGVDAVAGVILAVLDHSIIAWILLVLNVAAIGLLALYRRKAPEEPLE